MDGKRAKYAHNPRGRGEMEVLKEIVDRELLMKQLINHLPQRGALWDNCQTLPPPPPKNAIFFWPRNFTKHKKASNIKCNHQNVYW